MRSRERTLPELKIERRGKTGVGITLFDFGKPKWWDGKEECAPSVSDMRCGGGHVEDHRKGGWFFFLRRWQRWRRSEERADTVSCRYMCDV